MMSSRALAVVCALAVAAAVVPAASAAAGDGDEIYTDHAVGVRVLELEDSTRATPADPEGQRGPVAASPVRSLPTTVFYPAAGDVPEDSTDQGGRTAPTEPAPDAEPARGRFPVILFSHGAPGSPHDYRWTLVHWASQGYVVVAPQYPVTSTSGPTDVAWTDARDQVRDARYVLTEVLALDRTPWEKGGLGGRLARRHVAAAGHSMGGLTTLAQVSECCGDRRIDAALVLAGVSEGDAGPRIVRPRGPILFAHATLDPAVPFTSSEGAYRRASAPKYLLEIRLPIGGVLGHLAPLALGFGDVSRDVSAVIDDFLAASLNDDSAAAERLEAERKPGRYLHLRSDP
jgi:dienelactone hydrolase